MLPRLDRFFARAFFAWVKLAFSTFAVARFVAFAGLALPLFAEAAASPWSARGLSGAECAVLKATLNTPAARAAVTTVNLSM
jgi:hypothetical protein